MGATIAVSVLGSGLFALMLFVVRRLFTMIDKLDTKIDAKIDQVDTKLSARIDQVRDELAGEIKINRAKIDGLATSVAVIEGKLSAKEPIST